MFLLSKLLQFHFLGQALLSRKQIVSNKFLDEIKIVCHVLWQSLIVHNVN